MPKNYGLGRGLSSLFGVYETKEPEQKQVKKVKREEIEVKKEVKKETAPQKLVEKETALKDIPEVVEHKNYLEEKQTLSQKLSKLEQKLPEKINEDEKDRIFEIPLKDIEPNTNQPRKNFDNDSLMELADSIRAHGIIQPIIVQKNGDKFIIVAGERRFRAARKVGLKTIRCIIQNYSIQAKKEIALVENVQREDLNPVEIAFAIKKLVDDYNLEMEEVAEKIGKTRSVVSNYLRILRLEPEVLTMVEKGKLTFAHAKALVAITDREEQIKLAKKSSDGKISSRELEIIVQNIVNPDKVKKPRAVFSPEIKELVGNMQQVFGTKVSVIGNNKRGRIYIDYFNQDDLDRIAELLTRFN